MYLHGHDRRAQLGHTEAVELLPFAVDGAHVDDALEVEHRARRRRRHSVLPSAGLGDDAALAELDR